MKARSISYNFKQGFQNIFYNKMFSFASVATMVASIFLFGIFYSILVNFEATIKNAESGVAVTVFFDEGISQERINEIGTEISRRPEVSEFNYISPEDAWENFKTQYFEGREELAEGFADDNPLANDASYEIYMNDISMQQTLVAFLESTEGIREVNQSEVAANTLSDLNRLVSAVSLAIVGVLIVIAIFLISNTVAVGINVHKDDIAIMKMIGAKDNFVRAPFIVEGVVIGFVGSAIPLGILYYLYGAIIRYVASKFSFLSNLITFQPVNDVFRILVPVALILGLGIGYLGSRITIHKHLRV
ncbi:MAG: permease-like cell division protein FtsX [Lachnospiraceae bacterium]|nr:permease-like cell division protein FtsX [Lachnospiraceae bacterium]